ncbi:unnamed protein product, partial [Ectocarpus sp. 12 AP-2014]
ELRRLRFKAVAVVNADDIEPPLHPSQGEAYSHHVPQSRNELPSPVIGAENGTEFESPTSSPSPSPSPPPSVALPCGEDQTTKTRGLMFRRRRENRTGMQAVPEGGHDTAGCSGHDRSSKGKIITFKDSLAGDALVGWSHGSTGSFAQAPVHSLRDGKHVLEASTYDHRRGPADASRRVAAAGVAGHQGRQFGSGDGGRDVPKQQSRCAHGTGDKCAEERQEEDEAELSLDLSDCSNEKLGSLLEQGRRRGSGRAGPCTSWRSDLGA